jgi:hypothetical protein
MANGSLENTATSTTIFLSMELNSPHTLLGPFTLSRKKNFIALSAPVLPSLEILSHIGEIPHKKLQCQLLTVLYHQAASDLCSAYKYGCVI